MPRKSRSASRSASRSRRRRAPTKYQKKAAYAPSRKKKFIARSNPVSENKQTEGSEISLAVGNGINGVRILTDLSTPPTYLATEPAYDGTLALAGLPTGAVGFPINTAVYHFNPDSCLYQTHGFDESQMVGRSTYQRMCAAKLLFRWPQSTMNTGHLKQDLDPPDNTDPLDERKEWIADPANNLMGIIPETPQNYHLYWGFVSTKTGYSGYTTPHANKADAVTLENHINHRVQDFFNERQDRTKFISKVGNSVRIIGKKKIMPPWNSHSGRLPVSSYTDSDVSDGSIPDTLVKITWPINRKIHFEPTEEFGGANTAVSTPTVFYKNQDWLPFAVIVNYNVDKLPKDVTPPVNDASYERTRRVPHVIINDITYYRDQ